MKRWIKVAVLLAIVLYAPGVASAGPFRHNSLLRHYGPRGVYPAHYYDYYAPPTGYGHWGLTTYQAFGVGYNSYPYPYRAYYAGYGYGGYKTGESFPFFNTYDYAYPPQTGSRAKGGARQGSYGTQPAVEEPQAEPGR